MVQACHSNRFSLIRAFFVSFTLLSALQGCGGGGGGSSTTYDLTIDNVAVSEGSGTDSHILTFTVSLSEPVDKVVTVEYTTVNGTAKAGEDFTPRNNETLTIPKNTSSAEITIDITADGDAEADETFTVQLSNPQGVSFSASSQSLTGTGTITNDDNASKGYFAGSATLGGTDYTDVMALVYDQRILLFSPSANLQYDISMTSYDGTDYTGTVEVYVDGSITQKDAVTVTGSTNLLELSGTFGGAGTGFGTGTFSVTYDVNNNKPATLARIEANPNFWTGNIYGIDQDDNGVYGNDSGIFIVTVSGATGEYVGSDNHGEECVYGETTPATLAIPDVDTNIYELGHSVEYLGFGTCNTTYESAGHTGFAAVIDDTGTDDELVYAFDNGEFALFAVMHH